jgi:M6 family metalloprotease-like protein
MIEGLRVYAAGQELGMMDSSLPIRRATLLESTTNDLRVPGQRVAQPMEHPLSCALAMLCLIQGTALPHTDPTSTTDDRVEVRKQVESFQRLARDPDRDAEALTTLDSVAALYPQSGPHDKGRILNSIVACVNRFDAPKAKDAARKLPLVAAERLSEMGPESLRSIQGLLADSRVEKDLPRVASLADSLVKLALGSAEALEVSLRMLDDSNPRFFMGLAPALVAFEPDSQARRKRVCGALLRAWETFSIHADNERRFSPDERAKLVESARVATLATLNALALQRQSSVPAFKVWYSKNKDQDWPQSLRAFGYQCMTVNRQPALGTRPLLVLLAEYTGAAYPPFSKTHPASYYEKLAFGPAPARPFTTPENPASLSAFVKENSNGRFAFTRAGAGVVGPLDMKDFYAVDPGPEQRSADIFARAAALGLVRFSEFDVNHDGSVGSDELTVVIVENIVPLLPANRISKPIVVSDSGGNTTVSVAVAFVGTSTPFFQIAHETMHSLGARDLYASGNALLTTMGAYSFDSDDQCTVSLDAWHKLMFGWIEPRVFQVNVSSSAPIDFDRSTRPNGSALFWDPSHGPGEFFLLERRASIDQEESAPLYDANVADTGIVIWHYAGVKSGAPTVAACGAPSLIEGGNVMWKSGAVSPALTWANGMKSISFKFTSSASGSPTVEW